METKNENDTTQEEILEKIERIEAVEEDNNQMLKKLYNSMRLSRAIRVAYLLLLLSIMLGAYYYIQPYVGSLVDTYTGAQGMLDSFKNIGQ